MGTSTPLEMIDVIEAKKIGVAKRFRPGKVLFWQNDPVDYLFLVQSGKVKTCTLSEDGKNRTYGIWGHGSALGTTAHFLGEKHLTTAYVVQTADILIVSPAELDALVAKDPLGARAVIHYLAQYVKLFLREIDALSFLDVQERLKRNLESLASHHGHHTPDGIQIDLAVTHEEIAELTGANRTTITAHLNNLKKQGYLWTSGRYLIILPHDHIRILENLHEAVLTADADTAIHWTLRALQEKIDLVKLLDVFPRAMHEVELGKSNILGKKPELVEIANVARQALETLLSHFIAAGSDKPLLGSVVLGAVQEDTHDLGKLMVSILLARAGFRIIDLGFNVGLENFAVAVQEHQASVLVMSSATPMDREQQESARDIFGANRLSEQVALILGGEGFSKEYAASLGAMDYAGTPLDAARIVSDLSERKFRLE